MDSNTLAAILGAILIGFILSFKMIVAYSTDEYVVFTLEDKERIVKQSSSKYIIFTDKGTFQNTDTIFYWKWNSSDLYGNMKRGKTYKAHVYGFRFGLFSWYKNIISIELIH